MSWDGDYDHPHSPISMRWHWPCATLSRRRLIGEAISAYRGGALRAAIVSTWIAVAYDIIAKARELAAQGEAAPKAFVQDLDSAMANRDIKKMQTIESDLLKIANDQLQLFAPHELDACEQQRPQPVCPSGIYLGWRAVPADPGAGAVSHCSRAPALAGPCSFTGEKRNQRFDADVVSPSFPTNCDDIGTYIRAKYLDRAKDVLVTNLIKALVSAPFGDERARFAGRLRLLAMTLQEIAKAKTAIYDTIMPDYVARKFDTVGDEVLLSMCPFLRDGHADLGVALRTRPSANQAAIANGRSRGIESSCCLRWFCYPSIGRYLAGAIRWLRSQHPDQHHQRTPKTGAGRPRD